ncbi:ABC transporter ATP-binding protein [uncultured Tateyamaria sp.]|uniref:ABC transporter ATP-binding protein n=1 Tax=uncultured Tateyamaria sp. TaxID=455651 RepID=UPI002601A350|nr:ATP-binding cassette domain-containing protein [uncultured Tateyamaria sp.]
MASSLLDVRLQSLRHDDTRILQDVSFQLMRGETLALVGPSGIGKSSLLRVIASLNTEFEGSCALDGTCAMVFQEPTLLPWRTVSDNIRVTTGATAKQVNVALADVGLAGRCEDYPGQLSLGQQRRLALARAFAVKPDLLLLDEPFVSLDPALVDEMMVLFARLRAMHNVTTILVTHVAQEAKKLASRIVTLGGNPATIVGDVQNEGAYFQLSASGVTSSRS